MVAVSRSYREWLSFVKEKLLTDSSFQIVIRHDIDYNIHPLRTMLSIEREMGLKSVSYYDVHNVNYNLNDVASLVAEFEKDGFLFGLHINVSYDSDDPIKQFCLDVDRLRKEKLPIHSTVAHLYNVGVAGRSPVPTNLDIEMASSHLVNIPSFFEAFFKGRRPDWRITDGGGILGWPSMERAIYLATGSGHLCLHPDHFRVEGDDAVFVKPIGKSHPNPQEISRIQQSLATSLTPYLAMDITMLPHLNDALVWLQEVLINDYRRKIKVLDVGCGIGLLGAFLMSYHNVEYIGVDIEPKYIEVAKIFMDKIGYNPQFTVGNFFEDPLPNADYLIFIGAEDCLHDYSQILEIVKNRYANVFLTTATLDYWSAAKERGKHYTYISPKDLEFTFAPYYHLVKTSTAKRVLYHFQEQATKEGPYAGRKTY